MAQWESISLARLLKEILADLACAVDGAGVHIEVPERQVVNGQIRALLVNLISNALTFRKRGERHIVEIRSIESDGVNTIGSSRGREIQLPDQCDAQSNADLLCRLQRTAFCTDIPVLSFIENHLDVGNHEKGNAREYNRLCCKQVLAYARDRKPSSRSMPRDNRMSRVLHVLIHLDRHVQRATSEQIAKMLSTNAVVVRRMMSGLREQGIVTSERGHGGGWQLGRELAAISLLDIYRAIGEPLLFNIGPSSERPECLVEQAVDGRMARAMGEAEAILLRRFAEISVADLAREFDDMLEASACSARGGGRCD